MKIKTAINLLVLLCTTQLVYAEGNCFDALAYDDELQLIRDKVVLISDASKQTFDMLANESFPTSEEAQVVYKWGSKRDRCFRSFAPPRNAVEQAIAEGFNTSQRLILNLYKGNITYGQFAIQRQEQVKIVNESLQNINSHQQMRQQQMPQQRPAYIPPRETTSTCGWQGNQWICNTQPSGIDWGLLNTHSGEEFGRVLQPR